MNTLRPVITLTSDFGVQSQGVGTMEAVVYSIAPQAKLFHLMHGLPEFDIKAAARTMETVRYMLVGIHVCVCDPGVGTTRKAIAILTKRGDYFVGPDNGVFLPATRILGGAQKVHQISNSKYMRLPVSAIFHGRDIFAPAAAHLACGVAMEELGPSLDVESLVKAPYEEATLIGNTLHAQVIQINRFGSVHLNILHEHWDALGVLPGHVITMHLPGERDVELPVGETFGDVEEGHNLIMKDDYGRIEVAKNLGAFVSEYPLKIGDAVDIAILFCPTGGVGD